MAPADPPNDGVVTGHIRDFMDGLTIPCFITGPILEVVAYNALANAIYEFDAYEGPFADSHIWRLFMDPVRQSLYGDMLPEIELRTAGVFRTRYAEFSGSPRFDALLTALLDSSPRFARCWSHGHTAPLDIIVMNLTHRRLGPLNLATVRFAMVPISGHLMITMPAADPATQRAFEHLQWRSARRRERPGAGLAAAQAARPAASISATSISWPTASGPRIPQAPAATIAASRSAQGLGVMSMPISRSTRSPSGPSGSRGATSHSVNPRGGANGSGSRWTARGCRSGEQNTRSRIPCLFRRVLLTSVKRYRKSALGKNFPRPVVRGARRANRRPVPPIPTAGLPRGDRRR